MECRSFAQGRDNEGARDAAGTEVSGDAQERAMPKPQPRQATWALGMSIPPLLAYNTQQASRHSGVLRLDCMIYSECEQHSSRGPGRTCD